MQIYDFYFIFWHLLVKKISDAEYFYSLSPFCSEIKNGSMLKYRHISIRLTL